LIEAAESFINEYCNRNFARIKATEYFNGPTNKLLLANYPIDSDKDISIWDSWDRTYVSGDLIPSSDYFVDYDSGIVHVDYEIGGTPGSIKITYTGGEWEVPYAIRQACIELVARKIKEGPSGGLVMSSMSHSMTGSVSFVIEDILPQTRIALDKFWKPPVLK
jgi:hypothetical protein